MSVISTRSLVWSARVVLPIMACILFYYLREILLQKPGDLTSLHQFFSNPLPVGVSILGLLLTKNPLKVTESKDIAKAELETVCMPMLKICLKRKVNKITQQEFEDQMWSAWSESTSFVSKEGHREMLEQIVLQLNDVVDVHRKLKAYENDLTRRINIFFDPDFTISNIAYAIFVAVVGFATFFLLATGTMLTVTIILSATPLLLLPIFNWAAKQE